MLADAPLHLPVRVSSLTGERPVVRRLMEMGLVPGTVVTIVRVAPMNDPLVLRIRDYQLSIRHDEARNIRVHPV